MKESKPIYYLRDNNDFTGILWETELGNILTTEGNLSIKNNIEIYNIDEESLNTSVDLRNVLMSILPRKE